jgi:hypothetical protein
LCNALDTGTRYSSWFDASVVSFMSTNGFDAVRCTFVNFATASQFDHLLYDPTVSQNQVSLTWHCYVAAASAAAVAGGVPATANDTTATITSLTLF